MEELDIINETNEVIGKDSRQNVHAKGLLHREVRVWFYTPERKIILQLRSKRKDMFPNLLDATVGGHVNAGSTYEDSALREIHEETGLSLKKEDIVFNRYLRRYISDSESHMTNNSIGAMYLYCYKGRFEDLKSEKDDGGGFELWPLDKLLHCPPEDIKRLTPIVLTPEMKNVFEYIERLKIE